MMFLLFAVNRYRQAGLGQGLGHSCYPRHPRYEARYASTGFKYSARSNVSLVAFFRCLVCQHTVQEEIDRGRINEPQRCPREECNKLGTMTLIHNRSEFADKQVVRLQETPGVYPRPTGKDGADRVSYS